MDKIEALSILTNFYVNLKNPKSHRFCQALYMAIEALKAERKTEWCNDCDLISRQAAIEICEWYQREFCEVDYALDGLIDEIRELPSAERKGRWVESNPQNSEICRLIKCSECGKGYVVGFNVPYAEWTEGHKFCVECGARMEVEHE